MPNKISTDERREHRRFRIRDKAYALIDGPAFHPKVVEIADLSIGGIAFRYLNYETMPYGNILSYKPVELDILLDGANYSLGEVAIKTISDTIISKANRFSFVTIRECRVKFQELTGRQKSQLANFIKTHTIKQEEEISV